MPGPPNWSRRTRVRQAPLSETSPACARAPPACPIRPADAQVPPCPDCGQRQAGYGYQGQRREWSPEWRVPQLRRCRASQGGDWRRQVIPNQRPGFPRTSRSGNDREPRDQPFALHICADQWRRLAAALAERPVVIRHAVRPCGLGMAQQHQAVCFRPAIPGHHVLLRSEVRSTPSGPFWHRFDVLSPYCIIP